MRLSWLLTVSCLVLSCNVLAENLATVNGVPIGRDLLARELQANPDLAREADAEQKLLDKLINGELLVQEAKALELEKDPKVVKEIEGLVRQILANAAANRYLEQHPVTEAEIKAKYDDLVARADKTEYHARHILVLNESEALALRKKLSDGADFAQLAGEHSQDKANAAKGGDLGWFLPSIMVREFGTALKNMKTGEVSLPIQTPFGWHVVELLDSRPASLPTLEQARRNVTQIIANERIDQHIAELRGKATISKP